MRQKISPTAILNNEQMVYFLMTEEEALKQMRDVVREVNEVLMLPSTTLVRLILHHFRWDKNTVLDRFYENPDQLFQTLNVANPNISPSLQWDPLSPACAPKTDPILEAIKGLPTTCRTCCSETTPENLFALRCRHQHCLDCWQAYLESKIVLTGCTQSISCISRCNQVIDDEQIVILLKNNPNLCQRYQQFLLDAYVNGNRLTHWCPGNGCLTVVKMKNYSRICAQLIECDTCKTNFCFQCCKQWHAPIQCSILDKWEQKNKDESMTGQWLTANTKDCPKCHSAIEKNGGCNHMTCRKPGCGHEFCWICFGDWRGHATQQCNVYRQTETENAQSQAREILQRYMHYFTRYQAHHQSLEFEGKLASQVEERKREMQAGSMSFTEQQAIGRAFEVLQQCRRTLKYTYPFAFYLKANNQSIIFEDNQADLERGTEFLSGFLEREIDVEKNTIAELMNKTVYCEQRRQVLLDHCKDGYAKHYWEGLDPY